MSLESVIFPRHCAIRQQLNANSRFRMLFLIALAIIMLISVVILVLWLTLRPNNPQFTLQQADVYLLNLVDLQLLNSTIQTTLSSKNPNRKSGILFETVQIFAVYKGQQITPATSLLGFYQGTRESNSLSAALAGAGVAVAPTFGEDLGLDRRSGRVEISIRVMGRLRWKIGSWVSRLYRFNVLCGAVLPVRSADPTALLSLPQPSPCSCTI